MGQIPSIPAIMPTRHEDGRWKPGASAVQANYVSAKARLSKYVQRKSFKAIQVVSKLMEDETASPAVRLAAAQVIIERAFGKSVQQVEVTDHGRSLEEMLIEIWQTKQAVIIDGDKLIEPVQEPSE